MFRRLLNRVRYRRFDRDVAEEMAFHRELKVAEGGGDVDRAMGNELRMREAAHDVWVPPSLDALAQDLRHAVRALFHRPVFTVTVAAVLAVGVTVSMVAFAMLDALVLRPLPVDRPHQLVYMRDPSFSFPQLREVRAQRQLFPSSFAWNLTQLDVRWTDVHQPSLVMLASGEMYETLAIRPAIGRLLMPSDEGLDESSAQAVGVLSYRTWQNRFAADPSVLGRMLRIENTQVTIVGVTPREFLGVSPGRAAEITIPVTLAPRLRPRDARLLTQSFASWLHFIGRLPDGLSVSQADAAFQLLWRQTLEATVPADLAPDRRANFLGRTAALESAISGFSSVRNQFQRPLTILASFAGLLLIITCATVANMLGAQTLGRAREVAMRMALGCGRARLCRQLLLEGVVLAVLASAAALAIGPALSSALVNLVATSQSPVTIDWMLDGRLLALSLALVAVTALAFSIAPMAFAVRIDAGPVLKGDPGRAASPGHWFSRTLVAAQIACSVVLLVGAGLFLRSLTHVLSIDPGFETRQLFAARLSATDIRAVVDQLAATRGVQAVAASIYPPISNRDGSWTQSIGIDGASPAASNQTTYFNAVSPSFFAAVGTPIVSGRDFEWSDTDGNGRVAIVNLAVAKRYFGDASPLGHRITVGFDASRRDLVIVGVAGDAKYQRLQEEQRDIVYMPYLQASEATAGRAIFATIRMASLADDTLQQVRTTIAGLAPGRMVQLERVSDRIRESLVTERALAFIALTLAACALLLSSAGVFGLMSHLVTRRTREIGVRMALGAGARQVLLQIVGQALVVSVAGLLIGMAIALASTEWIRALLHFVSATDAFTYAAVGALTLILSILAGWLPARRAASVDPVTALRAE
jgi:predicted permease